MDGQYDLANIGCSFGDYAETIKVPSYNLIDLGLTADLGKFIPSLDGAKANLSVTNVTDKQYVSSCVSGWEQYCWFGEGREFRVDVTYDW
jgi:iron complex outermembrane receptor protein